MGRPEGGRGRQPRGVAEDVRERVGAVERRAGRGLGAPAASRGGRAHRVDPLAQRLPAADGGDRRRRDPLANRARGDRRAAAAAAQQVTEGGPRDEDHRGDQPARHDDPGAHVADRRARHPVPRLAQVPAELADGVAVEPDGPLRPAEAQRAARERDQERAGADREPEPQRAGGRQGVVEDERDPDRDQRQGHEGDRPAHEQAQAALQPAAHGADAEAQEERDAEEDRQGDQPEPHQLAGLVGAAGRRRALAGAGGRAGAAGAGSELGADGGPPGCRARAPVRPDPARRGYTAGRRVPAGAGRARGGAGGIACTAMPAPRQDRRARPVTP